MHEHEKELKEDQVGENKLCPGAYTVVPVGMSTIAGPSESTWLFESVVNDRAARFSLAHLNNFAQGDMKLHAPLLSMKCEVTHRHS